MTKLLFGLVILFSCNSHAQIRSGKIIGNNDLIEVNASATNVPDAFKELVDAIGWTNYGCTVTHIGNGYALSAGHCFDARSKVEKNLSCSFVTVRWKYRTGLPESGEAECERIVALQNVGESDFAILKMKTYPKEFIEVELGQQALPDDEITIFSHPGGSPLNWSQICRIERQSQDNIPEFLMQYSCDTEAGSSGAVVINAKTLKVVAVHKGGYSNMNYGTFVFDHEISRQLRELGF